MSRIYLQETRFPFRKFAKAGWPSVVFLFSFFTPNIFFFCEWRVKGGRWGMLRILWVACPSLHHIYSLSFSSFFSFFPPSSFWRFTSPLHQAGEAFPEQIKAFFSFHPKGSLCKQYKVNMQVSFDKTLMLPLVSYSLSELKKLTRKNPAQTL